MEQVDEEVRRRRADIIMEEQMRVMERDNQKKIGSDITVILEGVDQHAECFFGRSACDAPDIDGKIFFTSAQKDHVMGDFVTVHIDEVCEYDLVGTEVLPE